MTNCTRCTEKPIVNNHMCEECEAKHTEWLKQDIDLNKLTVELTPNLDYDGFYTIYESGMK